MVSAQVAFPYLISQPPRGAGEQTSTSPGIRSSHDNQRPTVVFRSFCVTLHFLSWWIPSLVVTVSLCLGEKFPLVHFIAALALVLGRAANVPFCCVSLGVGNERLSNGDSYFTLSIIYGETRFRKGHCMLVIITLRVAQATSGGTNRC